MASTLITLDSVTVALATAVALLSYFLSQRRDPDVHPAQLRYQADFGRTRNKGETAVLRNKLAPNGVPLMAGPTREVRSAYDMIWESFRTRPTRNFLGYRPDGSPYVWLTFKQIETSVLEFGSGLLNLCGLRSLVPAPDAADDTGRVPGDDPFPESLVGIVMKNSVEWSVTDFACATYGLVSVPLYPTFDAETMAFVIEFAELGVVVVGKDELDAVLSVAGRCKKLKYIIIAGVTEVAESVKQAAAAVGVHVLLFDDVKKAGKANIRSHYKPSHNEILTVCFTSGTSGKPKGAQITHLNVAAASTVVACFPPGHKLNETDRHLSYLPLCHMFERVMFYSFAFLGCEIGFYRGKTELLLDDLAELRPTLFPTVPRLLTRIYDRVMNGVETSGAVKKYLFRYAYNTKLAEVRKGRVTNSSLWDKLVFSKIQARLGGRVRMILTGAAPISGEILDFLRVVMGCQVLEGYGQTESCAAGFITMVGDYRTFPHVGAPFPACEYKLVDIPSMNYFATDEPNPRGEICIRGHLVMKGYLKAPELTAETIDENGWLHTGDVGMINPDGTLAIIDRVKAQFKLQQGEYISPEKIEIFTKNKWVLQSFVHGDSLRTFCVMIVVPDEATVSLWAKENNVAGSFKEICENKALKDLILKSLVEEGRKNGLKGFELPKAIAVSSTTFEELGILTPTFKTKRHEARKAFAKLIEQLYKENDA
ncbi:hypothetical protein HDU96_002550 [Phlyctochytrium bullatum]|nr:hypothetical protein HDU96_002550 [Phlyctochytrium bullatum]